MKTVLVICCIVLGVNTYTFDDAIYNQYLAKDFESLGDNEETMINHRIRRQAGGPPVPNMCCGGQDFQAVELELRETKKQCYKEVTGQETFHGKPFDPFNCEHIEQRKKELICVKQCVGKKNNILDEQGNLKEEEIKKFVTEHTSMDWLKPKLEAMFTKCLAEAKEATGKMDLSVKNACNPAYIKFDHCMFRETQLSCPQELIQDQRRCEIVRQFAKYSTFFPIATH